MTRRLGMALGGAVLGLLVGCATGPLAPTYSQADLRAECERLGGWWHPAGLRDGLCEYDSHQ